MLYLCHLLSLAFNTSASAFGMAHLYLEETVLPFYEYTELYQWTLQIMIVCLKMFLFLWYFYI